MIEPS